MKITTCIRCGQQFEATVKNQNLCAVCKQKEVQKRKVRKANTKQPLSDLSNDVRAADAAGKSYGNWRKDMLLAAEEKKNKNEQ